MLISTSPTVCPALRLGTDKGVLWVVGRTFWTSQHHTMLSSTPNIMGNPHGQSSLHFAVGASDPRKCLLSPNSGRCCDLRYH